MNVADRNVKQINDIIESKSNHLAAYVGTHMGKIPELINSLHLRQNCNSTPLNADSNPYKRQRTNESLNGEVLDMSMHSINDANNEIHTAAELDKSGEIAGNIDIAIDLTDSTTQLKVLSTQPSKIKYKYELCVSKFEPNESEKNLIAHIMKNTRIEDENLFNVTKLVKTHARLNKLSFVSFKIGTDLENVNNMIANPTFWPELGIKQFIQQTPAELKSLKTKPKSKPTKKNVEKSAPKKSNRDKERVQQRNTPNDGKNNRRREQISYVNRHQMVPAIQHTYQNYPNEAGGNNQHFFYNRVPMTWNPEHYSMAQTNWISQQPHAVYRPI